MKYLDNANVCGIRSASPLKTVSFYGLLSLWCNKGNLAQTTVLCTYIKYIFVQTKSQKQNAAVRLQGPQGPRQGWNKTLSKFIIIIIIIIIVIIVIIHHHRPFPTHQGSQRSNHRFVLKTQIFGSFYYVFSIGSWHRMPKLRCIFHGNPEVTNPANPGRPTWPERPSE